jgi:hypothetical protein
MPIPAKPKIYHIVHVDRLPSIIADGGLCCDAEVSRRSLPGTAIGMSEIKRRRLQDLTLTSHPDLHVGDCVPFYFCPRSIMLFLIHKRNAELDYQGGQDPIIHLEADLMQTINWANSQKLRWAFTLSNAGSTYFEDRCDLAQLGEINWDAVQATDWRGTIKEGKQAEFLVERQFPWRLVSRIGVLSHNIQNRVVEDLVPITHKPLVVTKPEWYY